LKICISSKLNWKNELNNNNIQKVIAKIKRTKYVIFHCMLLGCKIITHWTFQFPIKSGFVIHNTVILCSHTQILWKPRSFIANLQHCAISAQNYIKPEALFKLNNNRTLSGLPTSYSALDAIWAQVCEEANVGLSLKSFYMNLGCRLWPKE
jgi:hypothetical protein